jgi:hypothetical protein
MVSCAHMIEFYLESVSVSYRDSFEFGLDPCCLLDLDLNLSRFRSRVFLTNILEKFAFENKNKEKNHLIFNFQPVWRTSKLQKKIQLSREKEFYLPPPKHHNSLFYSSCELILPFLEPDPQRWNL